MNREEQELETRCGLCRRWQHPRGPQFLSVVELSRVMTGFGVCQRVCHNTEILGKVPWAFNQAEGKLTHCALRQLFIWWLGWNPNLTTFCHCYENVWCACVRACVWMLLFSEEALEKCYWENTALAFLGGKLWNTTFSWSPLSPMKLPVSLSACLRFMDPWRPTFVDREVLFSVSDSGCQTTPWEDPNHTQMQELLLVEAFELAKAAIILFRTEFHAIPKGRAASLISSSKVSCKIFWMSTWMTKWYHQTNLIVMDNWRRKGKRDRGDNKEQK